jgi:hypothetical protein
VGGASNVQVALRPISSSYLCGTMPRGCPERSRSVASTAGCLPYGPASQGAWVPRFVSRLARRPGAVVTPTVFLAMRAHCNEEAASLAIVEIAT